MIAHCRRQTSLRSRSYRTGKHCRNTFAPRASNVVAGTGVWKTWVPWRLPTRNVGTSQSGIPPSREFNYPLIREMPGPGNAGNHARALQEICAAIATLGLGELGNPSTSLIQVVNSSPSYEGFVFPLDPLCFLTFHVELQLPLKG